MCRSRYIQIGTQCLTPASICTGAWRHDTWDAYSQHALSFLENWLQQEAYFTLYTSGTTDTAKPLLLTRSQMQASARMTLSFLRLPPRLPFWVCLDMRYIGGMMQAVRALEHGHPLCIIPPQSHALQGIATGRRYGLLSVVPLQLHYLLAHKHEDLLALFSAVLVGGAPLSFALEEAMRALRVPVYHSYGLSETASHVALRRLNGPHPQTFFQLLAGIRARQDAHGCLTVQGAITNHQPVRTQDCVEMHGKHAFRWLGRIDAVINSGGVKIALDTLDATLDATLLERCEQKGIPCPPFFSYGLDDERLGQRLVLFVEGETVPQAFSEAVQTAKKHLPAHHTPKTLYAIKKFVYTPTSKIDKRKSVAAWKKTAS